jgi:hypothetical protein
MSTKKRVKFTPTERTALIYKSSFELDKNNYQTQGERAVSMREHYKELVEEDPKHFDTKERERKEHIQKTMAKLEKYGYMAEERPDGKFNVCSLETAGKCIVAASLSYAALRALGLFKGQSGAGISGAGISGAGISGAKVSKRKSATKSKTTNKMKRKSKTKKNKQL